MNGVWRIYSPYKRINPSGKLAWRARVRNTGTGELRNIGTYRTQGTAMDASQGWVERHERVLPSETTVSQYFERWRRRHPRPSPRTNRSNWQRIELYVLPAMGDMVVQELKRRHLLDLRDELIGRGLAPKMVRNIFASLSSMLSDAVDDEVADANPVFRLKVDARDPRFRGREQRKPRILTYDLMLELAAAAPHPYGGSVLFAGATGARPAEIFARLHSDLDRVGMRVLINSTAYDGMIEAGTKTDHGEDAPGRWSLLTRELLAYIDAAPRSVSGLLWPTPKGRVWHASNWHRDVFGPARKASGLRDVTPYDLRHSFVSLMHEAGIPDAEVASCTGHKRVSTLRGVYTHPMGRSMEQMRGVLGAR